MQIDILKLAEIIGACSVILGVIIGGYKLYDKAMDKLNELERRITVLEQENKRIKRENALLIKGLQGCLNGLQQLGCNGEVTDTKKAIDDYINNAAHDQD